MTNATITKSVFFNASRETVWAFLTEKEKLALWFQPAESDLVENQEYALIQKADDGSVTKLCWGTVLEMDKPSRLVYSFTIKPLGGAMTTVTWTLEEAHGGTKLSLRHEGICAAEGDVATGLLMRLDEGWDKHLTSLRAAIA
ncbi:MAG: ATPase [Alphaproteobacteria bacterium]|nr:MAG: ATPase [Alphaproteobacteria bacterium]